MAFVFLDHLFSTTSTVRIATKGDNLYRLAEISNGPLSAQSYVDLYLPNGFVIKNDENFRIKQIFSDGRGFYSKNDYIIVSLKDSELEYYVVELKSRNYKIEKIKRQLRTGVAMAAYCRRLGIDAELNAARFEKFSVYAVVLTNTVSEHRNTAIHKDPVNLEFSKTCEKSLGVYCVNGHKITLEKMKKFAFKVSLNADDVNNFDGITPYPGGPDDKSKGNPT